MELTTRLLQLGGLALPHANIVANIKNAYPFIDRIGKHDGPAQLRQYAQVASGTITFYHPAITGSETITNHNGTASVSVIVGGIVIGAGTCWEIRDNSGHFWTHCAALSSTSAVMWDVSGVGDHLVAEGLAEAVVTALCSTSRDPMVGTDWLDNGFSLSDGTQYADDAGQYLLPFGAVIPSLVSNSSAASWSWEWEQMLDGGEEIYVDGELAFEGV